MSNDIRENPRHHLDRRAHQIAAAAPDDADDDDTLLTTREMCAWFGMSPQWFEIGRLRGFGPPFVRISPNAVRYRKSDVLRWLEERTHQRTGGRAA